MKLTPTIYIFVGPPGSGKGTLAQECVKRYGWASLSTGALCRQHIGEETEIGKQIDFIIKSGKLISDELVTSMVDGWLGIELKRASGIILDGFPRTEQQVAMLIELLGTKYRGVGLHIIKFDISDDLVVGRLSSRLMCQNKECQRVYSILPEANLAPRRQGLCDVCGSQLVQRLDDKPEVIRERLAVFHDHDPSGYFKRRGFSVDVIAAGEPFEIVVNDFERLIRSGSA